MYSKKTTKNVITKGTIANELLNKNKKSLRLFTILSLVFGAIVYIVFSSIYSFGLKNNDVHVLGYVVYFVCLLPCLLLLVFFVLSIPASIKRQKKLNNGDFFVVTDRAIYKEEKTARRHNGRRSHYIKKVVHFYKFGEIEMNSTWYELTSDNDEFYMVVFDPNSNIAQKYYPAKLYEYKE